MNKYPKYIGNNRQNKLQGMPQYYQLDQSKNIQQGATAKVYQVIDNDKYVVKQIIFPLNNTNILLKLKDQPQILKTIKHPNIIKMYEHFYHYNRLEIVLQRCDYSLYSYIKDNKGLSQDISLLILNQILSGLNYLYNRNIVHLDIKPENVLIKQMKIQEIIKQFGRAKDERNQSEQAYKKIIKIIDFGLSKYFIKGAKNLTFQQSGSYGFQAPQILQVNPEGYDYTKCDVWSLGITFYEMLFGNKPDQSKLDYQLSNQKMNKKNITQQSKKLIRQMLQRSYKDRIDIITLKKQVKNIILKRKNQKLLKQSVLQFFYEAPQYQQENKENNQIKQKINQPDKRTDISASKNNKNQKLNRNSTKQKSFKFTNMFSLMSKICS